MAEGWGGLSGEPSIIREPTAEEIRDYRERTGVGLYQARFILTKAALIDATQRATTVDELKQVVMRSISLTGYVG